MYGNMRITMKIQLVDNRIMVFANGSYQSLEEFMLTYSGEQDIIQHSDSINSFDKRQYLNVDLKAIGLTQ